MYAGAVFLAGESKVAGSFDGKGVIVPIPCGSRILRAKGVDDLIYFVGLFVEIAAFFSAKGACRGDNEGKRPFNGANQAN